MATQNNVINVPGWLTRNLRKSAEIVNSDRLPEGMGPYKLGIDLGTSDIVSMVLNQGNQPVAVCLDWADVVRDGIVLNFHGAVKIVRKQLAALEKKLGVELRNTNTSYPPGTDPRISVNVLEAAGLEVTGVIDEPSAVANLLTLDKAAVVDIGGGTTGIAILHHGKVIYSGDEPTGGRHVTLTIAGAHGISMEEAETMKLARGKEVWSIVRPVFQKMADIVRDHMRNYEVNSIYLSGGSCSLPGVQALFEQEFPDHTVVLPESPIFLTPYAIAAYARK